MFVLNLPGIAMAPFGRGPFLDSEIVSGYCFGYCFDLFLIYSLRRGADDINDIYLYVLRYRQDVNHRFTNHIYRDTFIYGII